MIHHQWAEDLDLLREFRGLDFCLVRTDASAKKHDGISFILFDMASKGVSTKPILLISGRSPFCETFFDNVRVPKSQLVAPPTAAGTSRNICYSTSAR